MYVKIYFSFIIFNQTKKTFLIFFKMSDKIWCDKIKENKLDDLKIVCQTLIKILKEILDNPNDASKRKLYLDSDEISNKLMPFTGGLETLFEIGFQDVCSFLFLNCSLSLFL